MAFMYDSLGRLEPALPMMVVMVRTVVTPRATRAGVAFLGIQNDTQDTTTMILEGT